MSLTFAARVKTPSSSPAGSRLLQRACACGRHTLAGGDCERCRPRAPAPSGPVAAPPSLAVGSLDDPLEREADGVADAVLRLTDRGAGRSGSAPPPPGAGPSPGARDVPGSSGRPLDPAPRATFERGFGRDLSGVRVHTGPGAAASAAAVGARAYTVGSSIVFGRGEPTPDASGRRLLAHELTHVLQQGAGAGRAGTATLRRAPLPGPALDEADPWRRRGRMPVERRPGGALPFREATELAECLRIMGPESGEYCRQEVLGEPPSPRILGGTKPFEFSLGQTAGKRSVKAFYFPGQTDERALIVGGVHGSELAGIEVAEILVEQLRTAPVKPHFSVVVDPQRPIAASGAAMEPETIMLLTLIDEFHPTRVAALHTTHDPADAGFFADPRTDEAGKAKGFGPDEALALAIADRAEKAGANVPGNRRAAPHAGLYPKDPAIVDAGKIQPRDVEKGTSSFGGWASTDVKGGRPAMTVITMEVDLGTPSALATNPAQRLKELTARSIALREVFLGPKAANSPP
jgi:hypothetical protein